MKPTTDDEVLALAEKIKQQRSIDKKYAVAAEQLRKLDYDIQDHSIKLRHECSVKFHTAGTDGHMDRVEVQLPPESGADLIQPLVDYIEEVQS